MKRFLYALLCIMAILALANAVFGWVQLGRVIFFMYHLQLGG